MFQRYKFILLALFTGLYPLLIVTEILKDFESANKLVLKIILFSITFMILFHVLKRWFLLTTISRSNMSFFIIDYKNKNKTPSSCRCFVQNSSKKNKSFNNSCFRFILPFDASSKRNLLFSLYRAKIFS